MWLIIGAALAAEAGRAADDVPVVELGDGLGLEEALRRALAGSEDVAIAEAGLQGARADQAAALSSWLPQVSGDLSWQHTFASEYDDLFDTGGGASPFGDLPFGAADTWRAGLSASQGIYQGGRVLAQRRLGEAGVTLAERQLAGARASVVLTAAGAWYDAALADQLLQIAERTLEHADQTLKEATLAHDVGRLPEFDVLRASVDAENQRVAVISQKRSADLARANLARVLHTDSLPALALPADPARVAEVAAALVGADEGPRAAVLNAELAVQSAEASLALTRSAALPYLGASASFGLVDYPDGPVPDSDWRKNISAGVALSVPIFGGGAAYHGLAAAKSDVEVARQRLAQTNQLSTLDASDAVAAVQAAKARWQASSGTVAQAERALSIAETRYREGISTQLELADARNLLSQATANRASASRDLALAQIRLSLLSALPIQVGGVY